MQTYGCPLLHIGHLWQRTGRAKSIPTSDHIVTAHLGILADICATFSSLPVVFGSRDGRTCSILARIIIIEVGVATRSHDKYAAVS